MAGALSLSVCPGAPRVKFVIGRPPPKEAAPDFIVPQPVNTTTELIDAFAVVNFSPAELVALLASHSVAGADDFAPPLAGYAFTIYWLTRPDHSQIFSVPFDSTPAVFDSKFPLFFITNDYINCFLLANIFIDVLLNGTLFPKGAYV